MSLFSNPYFGIFCSIVSTAKLVTSAFGYTAFDPFFDQILNACSVLGIGHGSVTLAKSDKFVK